jgi:hypothetical protein
MRFGDEVARGDAGAAADSTIRLPITPTQTVWSEPKQEMIDFMFRKPPVEFPGSVCLDAFLRKLDRARNLPLPNDL